MLITADQFQLHSLPLVFAQFHWLPIRDVVTVEKLAAFQAAFLLGNDFCQAPFSRVSCALKLLTCLANCSSCTVKTLNCCSWARVRCAVTLAM